jgi:hypothetical protein
MVDEPRVDPLAAVLREDKKIKQVRVLTLQWEEMRLNGLANKGPTVTGQLVVHLEEPERSAARESLGNAPPDNGRIADVFDLTHIIWINFVFGVFALHSGIAGRFKRWRNKSAQVARKENLPVSAPQAPEAEP